MTKPVKPENTVGIRHSIATKLLRVVFALYIIIAAAVTMSHMVMEYRYQKSNISGDLEGIQRTFEHALAVDMWNMGEESLRSTVKGMLEIPTVVGVEINNDTGKRKGFKDRDMIWVENVKGKRIKGPVKLVEGMHPDQLGIAGCHGHWARGMPIAKGKGQFFDDLIIVDEKSTDPLTQGSDACARVKVYKVEGR